MAQSGRISPGKGLIFNIQRFSIHDGPGIRDLVFIKGCPLRCKWCCNPESQNNYPEVAYNPDRCIGWKECGLCLEVCPVGAIRKHSNSKVKIGRRACTQCARCGEICPAQAIKLFGKYMTIDEIISVVEEDGAFYSRSGGGITVSGGEPLLQADFVEDLLKRCREHGLDTSIETVGYGNWREVEKICKHANLIFYDIKCLDSKKHKVFTGVPNESILQNIRRLSISFPEKPIIARTPIIPGFNDSAEEIKAIADFLTGIGSVKEYELLPYHGFGEPKYFQLGRKYPLKSCQPPTREHIDLLKSIADRTLGPRSIRPGF